MNRPSLYAAFGDKRAIYLTALRQQAQGMLNATTSALSAPWPLRRTLENFYSRAVGIYVGDAENGRGCLLVGTALVCLALAGKTAWGLTKDFSEQPVLDLLDFLLLVFIVVQRVIVARSDGRR